LIFSPKAALHLVLLKNVLAFLLLYPLDVPLQCINPEFYRHQIAVRTLAAQAVADFC
jgi:hypothetical protein